MRGTAVSQESDFAERMGYVGVRTNGFLTLSGMLAPRVQRVRGGILKAQTLDREIPWPGNPAIVGGSVQLRRAFRFVSACFIPTSIDR